MDPTPLSLSWWIHARFLGGAYPGSFDLREETSKLIDLHDAGIRVIVDLTEEFEIGRHGPLIHFDRAWVGLGGTRDPHHYHRFPIRDMGVPTRKQLLQILNYIDRHMEKNLPVMVHCRGGLGRTGVVAGTWLIRHGLETPKNVFRRMRLRAHRHLSHYHESVAHIPQTEEQVKMVQSWRKGL